MKRLMSLIFFTCINIYAFSQDTVAISELKIKVANGDWANAQSYHLNDTIPFTGLAVDYYENSKNVRTALEYKNGHTKLGKVRGYYESGKLQMEFSYGDIDGMEDGDSRIWYENGQLKNKGQYLKGAPEGIWLYYNEKGVLIKTEEYKDGELIKK